jgi:hypothetical protein
MPQTPVQRSTRSGSNASSLNLNDIKALIESSQADFLKSVKAEMLKYGEMFQSLLHKFDEMVKQNGELVSRVSELEGQVAALTEAQQSEPASSPPEDAFREFEERYKRRKFVIVSGLPEACSGTLEERCAQDRRSVESLIQKTGVRSFEFKNVSRIGALNSRRPRLLKFKCSSLEMKIALLRASRNLRRHADCESIYISPDLTRLQRERDRVLRTELRIRRQAGERVVIRAGKIVDSMQHSQVIVERQQDFV